MIWLGVPVKEIDKIVTGGKFAMAIAKAEAAHRAVRDAEASLVRQIKALDELEKAKEMRAVAAAFGITGVPTWAQLVEMIPPEAQAPHEEVDKAIASARSLLSANVEVGWRHGLENPPAFRLGASSAERAEILMSDPECVGSLKRAAASLREVDGAVKEAAQASGMQATASDEDQGGGEKMRSIDIRSADRIVIRGRRALVAHRVIGGGGRAIALQDMGTEPAEIEVTGMLVPDEGAGGKGGGKSVGDKVETLQAAMVAGEPLVFATDAPGLEGFGPTVILSEFAVLATDEIVGSVRFRCRLVEAPPAPEKRKRPGEKKKEEAKNWAREQAIKGATKYVEEFKEKGEDQLVERLEEAVRDRLLRGGTVSFRGASGFDLP